MPVPRQPGDWLMESSEVTSTRMKIYTGTGDDGTTGVCGSGRLSKADLRIECVGGADEVNAALGYAAAVATGAILKRLRQIQNELFTIGSHLATPDRDFAEAALPPLDDAMHQRLEAEIDDATAALPPLACFILPGGCELAARLHLARTICRRTERAVVALGQRAYVAEALKVYLNRLSDWLFVHSRLANHEAGYDDIPWHKG
jgi:cob(I)alamin adenosyltransferase